MSRDPVNTDPVNTVPVDTAPVGQIRFSPKAKRDLSDIWDYSHEQWGLAQAEIYIRDLYAGIQKYADAPLQAVAIDDVRKGYRKFLSGSHVIFFKVTGGGPGGSIDEVRILHKSMDFDRHI